MFDSEIFSLLLLILLLSVMTHFSEVQVVKSVCVVI